ncbi:hypothetical protein [Gottfriedia solisilvae]|uniref:Uncharacterized protein n=1 Tax=Gottfriedia solisilvae TaxID=1516104 RepID=A0A8J3AP62_9BACI|nr:hypothetical protein [Gottfriedia solisilvae]GGI17219.1 hypothetical protein GCM10007380_36850 [Gottfriedia solisilvae]
MIVVHFYDKNVELLNQLRNNAPSEGDPVVIKGRKGTILSVQPINDKHVNVLVELEVIKKPTFINDPKKKRR